MKSIALIHYAYYPNVGGVESLVREHALILASLGYDVKVIAGSGDEPDSRIRFVKNPEFLSLTKFNNALQEKILQDKKMDEDFDKLTHTIEYQLEQELKDRDIVIAHNMLNFYHNLPFVQAFHNYVKKNPGKKYFAWVHDHAFIDQGAMNIPEKLNADFIKELLGKPVPGVHYVAISETFKTLLTDLLHFPTDSITVIPNGVNIQKFMGLNTKIWNMVKEKKLLDRYPLILTPANIIPRKNIDLCLEIVKNLKVHFPNIFYLVSGQPSGHRETQSYFESLKKKRDGYDLGDNVLFLYDIFAEDVANIDLSKVYAFSDLVFYFSSNENFGLPLLEATLAKTPIFLSDIPVFQEVLGQKINVCDIKKMNALQLAGVIKTYLEKEIAIKLSHRVKQEFNLEYIITNKLIPLFG